MSFSVRNAYVAKKSVHATASDVINTFNVLYKCCESELGKQGICMGG